MSEWIKCGEKLPEEGVRVWTSHNVALILSGGRWVDGSYMSYGYKPPTHWMPLPDPPKEGE